jgi:hypothetical protein
MKNLVDALNLIKHAADTELALRQAASAEFNLGQINGAMKIAHDKAILNVIEASKNLIALSESK